MKRGALIGFGLAGSVFHAPFIAATPGLELALIVTSNQERAARAREEHPGVEVVSTADEVWKRAADLEFAVIATANDSHAPLARKAIESGLATVVDKPLAPSSSEAAALIETAEALGVLLTVYHQRRWDSDFLTLRRLVAGGELGEVHTFESRFERWRPDAPVGAWRFDTPREQGGGVLLDLGSHLVDQALTLFGPAREVHGEIRRVRGTPADDDAFVSIRHESGPLSLLWASEVAESPGPRLRAIGTDGEFVVDGLDPQEEAVRAGRSPATPDWGAVPKERWGRLIRGDASEAVEPERGAWPEFYARLAAGEAPVPATDALAVLRVLEAVG